MIMESGTEVLRKAASEWNLAGDKHLLQVLEQMHQKIISKCQEVNTKLDEMVNKLDNASVDLQNVNNKFMALSNSQFIESRVYDDDIISDGDSEKKTVYPADQESEMSKIKRSLQTFDSMHEAVRILDSDSSDDEEDFRTILKPKSMYSARPLPYIIGSHEWRTKWHVGLVPSDTESDSSAEFPKRQVPPEQYSESESEDESRRQPAARNVSSSSEVESEPSPALASPADIAAQIAKRLAAQQPPLEAVSREGPIPNSIPRKVYKPEQSVSATIFPEEPPPLEETVDDYSDDYSDDDDIFAELHKKPTASRHRDQTRSSFVDDPFVDQLFGDYSKNDEIREDYEVPPAKDNPTLHEDDIKSDLLTQKEVVKPTSQTGQTERTTKKPIGGMSLFGSSKGAESIGAAILKRNERKSSISDEENNVVEEKTQSVTNITTVPASTNKIIEDLFSKPKSNKKDTGKVIVEVKSQEQEKPSKAKVDLFSDNIFDDIDDIFTTEIVTKPKESNPKSIFDEDELFADIPTNTDVSEKIKKSLFDSDDELFKEDLGVGANINTKTKESILKEAAVTNRNEPSKITFAEKSIFSDNSDDIFSSNNNTPISQSQINPKIDVYHTPSNKSDMATANIIRDSIENNEEEEHKGKESKILNIQTASKTLSESVLNNLTLVQAKEFESPLLFGEDEIDDLFINNSKQTKSIKEQVQDLSTKVNTETEEIKSSEHSSKKEESVLKVTKDTPSYQDKNTNRILENVENLEIKKNNLDDQNIADNNKESKKNEIADIESISVKNTTPGLSVLEPTNVNSENDKLIDSGDPIITETLPIIIKQENQNDILDDIFSDLPPAFEKPSEPKKSKNINALFDDDSDDETLFFKKNDNNEEKPDVIYNDDRFRIFHDEPPDIDVDFSRKSNNTMKDIDSEEDLFSSPKTRVSNENISSEKTSYEHKEKGLSYQEINEDEEILTKTEISEVVKDTSLNISKLLDSVNVETDNNKLDYKTIENKEDKTSNNSPEEDTVNRETVTKKSIEKLKPMNININVNSLLPGASPTKQKSKDESDGLTLSNQSNVEFNKYTSQKGESKMVKSVSFDGDPGSEVLDNKLSKGRAKIQIKRRPSSRRARLEAVRKSGIDFGDDSTDNSSSFDEPRPIIDALTDYDKSSEFVSKDVADHNQSTHEKIYVNREIKIVESDIHANTKLDIVQNIVNTETKSKTVYILNDEDIFTDSPITHIDNNKKSLTVLDNDDELFKNPTSESIKNSDESKMQNALGSKTVPNKNGAKNKQDSSAKSKKSIFDDLSDDELFGGKESSRMSSSDNVKSKKENIESLENKKVTKVVVAKTLFGDDSDDDLFRTGKNSEVKPMKPKEHTSTISKPVTDDPLSLFDDS